MQDWIKEELEVVELDAKEFAEQNRIKFWSAPVGATKIEIDITHPVTNSKFEGKKVFHIFVDGEQVLWTVPKRSKSYGIAIRSIAVGKTKFNLIRIGQGKSDTKYELVPL